MSPTTSSSSHRLGPVCGTCRKKCRKCDRTRPHCLRCISKGLACEGYPLSFKIYDAKTTMRKTRTPTERRTRRAPFTRGTSPASCSTDSQGSPPARLQDAMQSIRTSCLCAPVEKDVAEVQDLLTYYETTICAVLHIPTSSVANPFETYILPLANQDSGLLNAVLGLTTCHLAVRDSRPSSHMTTAALEHRLAAIRSLSSLLLKEECFGLNDAEEEIALAIVLTLVMHDLCDGGQSMHGAHLNGVAFLCSRIITASRYQTPCKLFLITALTWFDLLRGYSGAEKLAFPSDVRQFVCEDGASTLSTLLGCPAAIFTIIGTTLDVGKNYYAKEIEKQAFQTFLDSTLGQLQAWDPTNGSYPNDDIEWALLADAYRHTATLRVLRFPDPWELSCGDDRVRKSVNAILDISAEISWDSTYFKRLLFPLFVAGAETNSAHQQRYVSLCIDRVRELTGFKYESLSELLNKTWDGRRKSNSARTAPWFEYTCSIHLQRQHDYLFF